MALTPAEQLVIKHGSVHAAADAGLGDKAASDALATLTSKAPEEFRGSWPMVINWSRMQAAYEIASELGRYEDMAKIAGLQTKMLRELY